MRFPKNIRIEIVKTHDEFEIGLKPKKYQKKQSSSNSKLYFPKTKKSFSKSHVSKNYFNSLNASPIKQNCSVIAKYRNDKESHLKNLEYIQKEGKSIDGDKPLLYGSENSEEEYKKNITDKNWRIILSPQSNKVDLNVLTDEFIKKLEEETGYKFTWIAANHYDTDNPHTHILINGTDKNGRDVRFLPREKVSQLFRTYAQNICTDMLGYRTSDDIKKDYDRMVDKNYFTKLDRALEKFLNNTTELTMDYLKSEQNENLTKRLSYLSKIGLCKYKKEKQIYSFVPEWKEELRTLAKFNTYYDGKKYSGVSSDKYSLYEMKNNDPVEGELKKIYTMQKDSNNFAVVIKTKDGRGLYVPLNFYPKGCRTGDYIKISNNGKKTYINNYNRKK